MRHFLWACLLWPCLAWADPSYAERVLAVVNDYRERQGLMPLQPSAALERIALPHSLAMAAAGRASHGSFNERFERSGSELCVENIAAGRGRPEQVVAGWRGSPEHDRNLLEPRVRWVGVASVEGYTTLFACTSDGAAP
jgi:uncharacterized protein YkwD